MAELGIGSVIQQAGSYWGLASIPVVGVTLGSLWLWQRGWRTAPPEIPSLDGLESPVRITGSK